MRCGTLRKATLPAVEVTRKGGRFISACIALGALAHDALLAAKRQRLQILLGEQLVQHDEARPLLDLLDRTREFERRFRRGWLRPDDRLGQVATMRRAKSCVSSGADCTRR